MIGEQLLDGGIKLIVIDLFGEVIDDSVLVFDLDGPTGIRLKFDDVLKAPELARIAAARLAPGLRVRDWTQDNEAYFRAIRIEKTMMGLILMLIVAVAVFNIVATLVMVVNDKRTDIAILRTLGLSPRGVVAVFMTQGVLIGWLGAFQATRSDRICVKFASGKEKSWPLNSFDTVSSIVPSRT